MLGVRWNWSRSRQNDSGELLACVRRSRCSGWKRDMWRRASHNAPLTRLPMFKQRWIVLSLGELKTGRIHRGHSSGGASLWGAFLDDLCFGIPRVLVSYNQGNPTPFGLLFQYSCFGIFFSQSLYPCCCNVGRHSFSDILLLFSSLLQAYSSLLMDTFP